MVSGPRENTALTPSGRIAPQVSIRCGASRATRSATLIRAAWPSGERASARVSLMVTVSMGSSLGGSLSRKRRAEAGSLLARLAHEHQHLAGADDRVVADLDAVHDGGAERVDVEAVAVTGADLPDGLVTDGQLLGVEAVVDRHQAGRHRHAVVQSARPAAVLSCAKLLEHGV